MGKKIILDVLESYTRDIGKGVARIDYDAMDTLNASSGDHIEIKGKKRIVARCLPLYPSDEGKGIIRIDGLSRDNVSVLINQEVQIEKIKAVIGEKVTVTNLEPLAPIDERYLVDALETVPLIKGQKFLIPYFGGRLQFEVLDIIPKNIPIVVTRNTTFEIRENPNVSVTEKNRTNVTLAEIADLLKTTPIKEIKTKFDPAKTKTDTEYLNRRIFSLLNNIIESENEINITDREYMLKQIWDEFNEFHKISHKTFPNNDFIPSKIKKYDEIKEISGIIGISQYMKSTIRNIADAIGIKHLEFKSSKKILGNDIFIVHGHDETAKEKTARFIERAELVPVILHEQPNAGKTIIEKFETYSSKIGFAIILLTPDDSCITMNEKGKEVKIKRSRQNVILELGFFVGAIGRDRTCILYKKGVEIPSDYDGVVYIEMDSSDAWKLKLAREIKKVGISIDMNRLFG